MSVIASRLYPHAVVSTTMVVINTTMIMIDRLIWTGRLMTGCPLLCPAGPVNYEPRGTPGSPPHDHRFKQVQ
jgi:hypothetical protein